MACMNYFCETCKWYDCSNDTHDKCPRCFSPDLYVQFDEDIDAANNAIDDEDDI